MLNFTPSEKDKIIVMLSLSCICASFLAFSVGFASGFAVAKSVRIQVGFHD
jgi:hypothetical protein